LENNKNFAYFIIGIIIVSFVLAIYFFPQMPENSASHWGSDGNADGFTSGIKATFTLPFIILGLGVFLFVIPLISSKNKNLLNFRKEYDSFVILFLVFFLYIYILTIYFNIFKPFDMSKMLFPALGAIFIYLGFRLEKIPRNNIMGIRTPWSVISNENWKETHKLGAVLFKLFGILFVITIFYTELSIYFIIGYTILMILILFIYSFILYKKSKL